MTFKTNVDFNSIYGYLPFIRHITFVLERVHNSILFIIMYQIHDSIFCYNLID
jgi:hypothetical protein